MPKPEVDWALTVVTDEQLSLGRAVLGVVGAAIAGGATVVQLREKTGSTRSMINLGRALRELTRQQGVVLIVNDRLDVALAVDADGLHVGQDDMPAAIARRLIGPDRILGVSAATPDEARAAAADGADYVGVGSVFATGSKADAGAPIGVAGIAAVKRAVAIPIVAIGGIHAANATACIEAGADGVAVISAIVSQPDPAAAARALRRAVDQARGR